MLTINASRVTGLIVGVKRHGHTKYGNPTMSIILDIRSIDDVPVESTAPVTIRIQNNSGLVYGIENREYRETEHEYTLSRAGRIVNAQRV